MNNLCFPSVVSQRYDSKTGKHFQFFFSRHKVMTLNQSDVNELKIYHRSLCNIFSIIAFLHLCNVYVFSSQTDSSSNFSFLVSAGGVSSTSTNASETERRPRGVCLWLIRNFRSFAATFTSTMLSECIIVSFCLGVSVLLSVFRWFLPTKQRDFIKLIIDQVCLSIHISHTSSSNGFVYALGNSVFMKHIGFRRFCRTAGTSTSRRHA